MTCQDPLGIESGNVTGDQLTSSSFDGSFQAANAILNQEGAWVPATNDQNQWLQIDLHRQLLVSGVVIQGTPDSEGWVTRYQVKYALDGVSWETVSYENTSAEVCNLKNRTECFHHKLSIIQHILGTKCLYFTIQIIKSWWFQRVWKCVPLMIWFTWRVSGAAFPSLLWFIYRSHES